MNANHIDIELILNTAGGVISRRQHPQLAASIDWLAKSRQLSRVLPGIYARPWEACELRIRLRAATLWAPGAIFTGRAAAYLGYWSDLKVDVITLATKSKHLPQPGFIPSERVIPPEFVMQEGPLLFTCPPLTALDLVAEMNKGEPIDVALRKQAASLDEMHAAFAALRNRRGNSGRGLMLADSRDEPWSEAERRLHRLMRAAGISDWKPNLTYWVTEKNHYFLDIAFKRLKIVIEVDGYEFHTQHAVFETDRDRQNRLVLDGWLVLRFTWKMIVETPEGVIATIRQAIALREVKR